jgi:hypothetical protein
MAPANDILASAQAQLAALQVIDGKFAAQIAAIKDAEWDRPLSDKELSQLSMLRAQQRPVLAAIEELSYVTMQALDDSDNIQRLSNALSGVVKGLMSESNNIAMIDGGAKNITAICGAISKLLPQIQGLTKV